MWTSFPSLKFGMIILSHLNMDTWATRCLVILLLWSKTCGETWTQSTETFYPRALGECWPTEMPQRLPHASVWPIRSSHHGVSSVLSLWWSTCCSRIFKSKREKPSDWLLIHIIFDFNHIFKFFCGSPRLSKWRWHFQPGGEGWTREQSNVIIQIQKTNYFPASLGSYRT